MYGHLFEGRDRETASALEEARARAVPGALEFARCAQRHGVTLVYVSNRKDDGERDPTIANLRALGFPLAGTGEDLVLLTTVTADHEAMVRVRDEVAKAALDEFGAPHVVKADGLAAGGRLAQALEERIAAEGSKAGGVLVSLSFQAGDGRYCRTFSLDTGIDGLACRSAQQWQIEAIGRSPRAEPAAAATAREVSSELSPAVIAAISRWQAGDALTPEQERRVRERDWQ